MFNQLTAQENSGANFARRSKDRLRFIGLFGSWLRLLRWMKERLDENRLLTLRCSLWIILDMWAIFLATRSATAAHDRLCSAC
jgi:hypothetical protein